MAQTTGPLHSDAARGQYAHGIIFQHPNGRGTAKAYAVPRNAPTFKQRLHRELLRTLANLYNRIDDEDRQQWLDIAEENKTSPFAELTRYNTERWYHNLSLISAPDPSTYFTAGVATTYTWQTTGRNVRLTTQFQSGITDPLCYIIFRATAANPRLNRRNALTIIEPTPRRYSFYDYDLPPGTYYYDVTSWNPAQPNPTRLAYTTLTIT